MFVKKATRIPKDKAIFYIDYAGLPHEMTYGEYRDMIRTLPPNKSNDQ